MTKDAAVTASKLGSKKTKRRMDARVAIAYLRTSTDDQTLGPEAQRADVERWARTHGVTIAGWYIEHVSGAAPLDARPVLWDAIDHASRARAGVLVTSKRCRLSRSAMNAELITRYLSELGIAYRSADGSSDDVSPEGVLMRSMLDAIAAYERALIGVRTRAALAAKKRRGERGPGSVPYGSRLSADGKRLENEPAEQETIERLRGYKLRGLSPIAIARELNERGTPARGARWHPTSVARILSRI
jgi:DNA invertase Pin-like site-specific DNA recombinase